MGFGISHQKVGINRVGKYLETAREKGPERSPTGRQDAGGTAGETPARRGETPARRGETAVRNEAWRRISDLVGKNAETTDPKIRKRCVKKLVNWIDRKVSSERLKIENCELKNANLTEEWGGDVSEWRRVACGGMSVEGICFRLGMTPAKLTRLLKETHGISAGELLDGFRIRGLRACLIGQLRLAAQKLWDSPGEFSKRRCMRAAEAEGVRRGVGRKRSRYFRTQPWEFLGLEEGEEQRIRVEELLGMLDRVREENDFSLEAFAVGLGFESARNFRRACLNVMGRTLAQLERILAREVVEYYLAAEDREMREIAFRADEFGFRAREIYCGDAEKVPEPPFLDRWSAWEFGKAEWIEKMREEFG